MQYALLRVINMLTLLLISVVDFIVLFGGGVFFLSAVSAQLQENRPNNVCPTFEDYNNVKDNPRCWYDFTAEFTAPDIIRLNGYPLVEYRVQTVDGFILRLFRIPSDNVKNPKAKNHPIYLQHGLVATCSNFIGIGKRSLAFVLSDAGYDVWLGNYRGNQYSEQHINMSASQEEYWNHSMDEIVQYDLPAIFNTILKHTGYNNKIIYIGHSLGTSLALMYGSKYPLEAKNQFQLFVLLSPAYTLNGMKSPYKVFAPFGHVILNTIRDYKTLRFFSQARSLQGIVRPFCLESPQSMRICFQMYNLFYGIETQMGPEIIPVYFNQLPGGTALKIVNHAADLVLNHFRHYNYNSSEENYRHYGTPTPPIYDIKKLEVPTYIVYSTKDWATTEIDAWNLWRNLPKHTRYGIRRINISKFNHIDFVFGRHAKTVVYDPLVKVLNRAIDSN